MTLICFGLIDRLSCRPVNALGCFAIADECFLTFFPQNRANKYIIVFLVDLFFKLVFTLAISQGVATSTRFFSLNNFVHRMDEIYFYM